jgi:hypothetical protein
MMDPTAFSLALGILAFVLSYSCFGIGWVFSLAIAVGTTIAMWLSQRIVWWACGRNELATENRDVRIRPQTSTIAQSS